MCSSFSSLLIIRYINTQVAAPHLKGALDRFAQFFVAPLFTQAATERELQAVNNEHMKNVL
jgi:insulysin